MMWRSFPSSGKHITCHCIVCHGDTGVPTLWDLDYLCSWTGMPVSTWQEEGRKSCVCQYFFSCHKHSLTILCWKKINIDIFPKQWHLESRLPSQSCETIHKLRQQRQVKAFFQTETHRHLLTIPILSPINYRPSSWPLLLRPVSSGSHFRYATCPGVTACSNQQPDTQLWNTPQEQQINLTSSLKHYSQNIRFKMLILISTAFKAQGQILTEKNVLFMPQIWY